MQGHRGPRRSLPGAAGGQLTSVGQLAGHAHELRQFDGALGQAVDVIGEHGVQTAPIVPVAYVTEAFAHAG